MVIGAAWLKLAETTSTKADANAQGKVSRLDLFMVRLRVVKLVWSDL